MITCDGCYMDALHENDSERERCIRRRICERAYEQGRADAIDEIYVIALNENHDTLIEWLQDQLEGE